MPMGSDKEKKNVQNGEASRSKDESIAHERGQWGNKAEFILSCVGLSVGLGNVWRFPYLAYQHGGAAFVLAYLILQILIGKPMYMMELILGQYTGRGPTGIWSMNPSAKGIGISMAIISLIVAIYYNVIMAYTVYYFFASMQKTLPWTSCKDEWKIDFGCVEKTTKKLVECTGNITADAERCLCSSSNYTINQWFEQNNQSCTNVSNTAVSQIYFDNVVLQRSDGMYPDQMGKPIWQLTLCLMFSWAAVIVCLIKGIKSSGKVVYFTATFPYVILLILLIRGCLLDGAIDGVKYFVIPDWNKLKNLEVWAAAAGQMFFSLSVCFGGIIMYGSYNKYSNNVYNDAVFIASMDLITSIIAGFVIFTTFGGMAKKIGVSVQDVAKGGYGLAFVAYPEALSNLPPPQLWSILFFFMLFTLGLDSEDFLSNVFNVLNSTEGVSLSVKFALLETTMTCIQDEFPKMRKYKSHMCVGLGVALFLCALPCVTPGGDYIVTLMDGYGADFSVLFVAVCESIAVHWVYGVRRFVNDVCIVMLGRPPRPMIFWAFCWAVTSPLLIAALFVFRMVQYKAPEISKGNPYPDFAQTIGWILTAIVLVPIPGTFIYKFIKAKGGLTERLKTITSPDSDWKPNDGNDTKPLHNGNMLKMEEKFGLDNPSHL